MPFPGLTIIGERINPGFASSKKLLDARDLAGIAELARTQVAKGAPLLNVNAGTAGETDPAFVVHPPLGKWTIALGEYVFGATPFGWRIAVAILGTLSILMVARITRRLTRSNLIGTLAGFLLAPHTLRLMGVYISSY